MTLTSHTYWTNDRQVARSFADAARDLVAMPRLGEAEKPFHKEKGPYEFHHGVTSVTGDTDSPISQNLDKLAKQFGLETQVFEPRTFPIPSQSTR